MNNPGESIKEWSPELLEAAKRVIVDVLEELPSGDVDGLATRIVERVATSSSVPVDEDALSNELQPFELLECVHSVSAEDDSRAFMGPNWCAFSAYKLSDNKYLIVQDNIEEGEYEVNGSASSSDEACEQIQEAVIDRLGRDSTITLSDGSKIHPKEIEDEESG